MAKSSFAVLPLAALFGAALAGPAADPMITPGPLLKRQNQQLVGYYPADVVDGSTTCM
jgi:hypothetical protein